MLRLKSVELIGFKSFSEKTRVEFPPGITAVVGPNGCGKSNLADAIHWVLGEQSARTLRGGRMADVIFNGTRSLPPTGLAEVNLTLVAEEGASLEDLIFPPGVEKSGKRRRRKKKPAAPDSPAMGTSDTAETPGERTWDDTAAESRNGGPTTVVVSRRLFRSGDSEYLINGMKCLLRDVQTLFMSMGLGPDSYAIIEQGRIGQILSSKPADRRAVMEEAAGISKFRTQKRLAEAKLESSRANLSRVRDILAEVTRQVNSLRRQAGKAHRFREAKETLGRHWKTALVSRWAALQKECETLGRESEDLKEKIASQVHALESREEELRALRRRDFELEGRIDSLRRESTEAQLERERATARLERYTEQVQDLEQRIQESACDVDRITEQIQNLDAATATKTETVESLRRDAEAVRRRAREAQDRYEQIAAQIQGEEAKDDSERKGLLDAVGRLSDLKNRRVRCEESLQEIEDQVARLDTQAAEARDSHAFLHAQVEKQTDEHREAGAAQGQAEKVWRETRQGLDWARREISERREELESLRADLSTTQARKHALEESLRRHTYATENVHHLLQGSRKQGGEGGFRALGILADYIDVTAGYETVVEEYLKKELDSLVVEKYEDARSGIRILSEESRGRLAFFIRRVNENGGTSSVPIDGKRDAILSQANGVRVEPLSNFIRFRRDLEDDEQPVLQAVAHAYVVSQSDTARKLALEFPAEHFLTAAGEHYHHRFVSGGKGPGQGPLALRRELQEVTGRLSVLREQVQNGETAIEAAEGRVRELEMETEEGLAGLQKSEKEYFLAGRKLEDLREDLGQAEHQQQTLVQEHQSWEEEKAALRKDSEQARLDWESASRTESEFQNSLEAVRNNLRRIRAEADTLKTALLEAQGEAKSLEDRTRFSEADLHDRAARRKELNQRRRDLTSQGELRQGQITELREAELQDRQRLEAEEKLREGQGESLATMEKEWGLLRDNISELEPGLGRMRQEVESLREEESQVKIRLARTESDAAHPSRVCQEEFGKPPEELRADLETILEGDELAAAEETCRRMRTKIESFGAVNMVALEELQEAEERKVFLTGQEKDLTTSIEDTASAIQELDRISRRKFSEAFAAINRYFSETFRILFGGGQGEMRLSADDDLDGGLDIVAQPPGKRLQNVLLLSGGEKAMTALALLIAIFRFRPSPFCLLDEVDAPLDDSNIGRFTGLVRKLSSQTQFILITHNKKTMGTAEVLYGVTMEEPGVSRIASVQLTKSGTEQPRLPPANVAATLLPPGS